MTKAEASLRLSERGTDYYPLPTHPHPASLPKDALSGILAVSSG